MDQYGRAVFVSKEKLAVLQALLPVLFEEMWNTGGIETKVIYFHVQKFRTVVSKKLDDSVRAICIATVGVHEDNILCRLDFRMEMSAHADQSQ